MRTLFLKSLASATLLSIAVASPLQGHEEQRIEAMTTDGRLVVLFPDHKWEFIETDTGVPESSAVLTVTEVKEMQDACGFQVHMKNNLGVKIRSLVPRFSIYNEEGIVYDHKSLSFTSIKPGRDQYRRMQFNGIGCHQIKWMRVHEADHCTVGTEVDKFNAEEGQCLSYIYVTPSELVNISKDGAQ